MILAGFYFCDFNGLFPSDSYWHQPNLSRSFLLKAWDDDFHLVSRHFWVGVRRNFNIWGINSNKLLISQYSSNSLRKKKILCNYPTLSLEVRHISQGWPRVLGLPSPAQEPELQEHGDKISMWEGWEVGRWVRRELI